MNPIFIVLVIVAGILLWFLLAFAFKPLGKLLIRLWDNANDSINKDNTKKEEKEKKEVWVTNQQTTNQGW